MAITKLDYEQVIQNSFDEPNNALRVTGNFSSTATASITGVVSVTGEVLTDEDLDVFSNNNINSSGINSVTGNYLQIVASTASAIRQIAVYDTTGSSLSIAKGAASGEINILYTGPGDSGTYPVQVPAGSRISIRSLESTAPSTGANIIVRLIK